VFYALAVTVPLAALDVFSEPGSLTAAVTLLPLIAVPAAITVAVLRFRLYDIDIVINKTVVFVALAGFITAVYAGIVVGLGRLLPIGEGNLWLAILATALVAVAFEPVRLRVQHWANRLVYGRRATPYEALAAMTASLGDSADPVAALAEAARLLAQGTGAAEAVVWVSQDGILTPRATAGGSAEGPAPVPLRGTDLPDLTGTDLVQVVRHEGHLVGALTLTKRPGVEELAGQAALLLANTRLRSRLNERLDELRASRRRLLAAQDRARHALERDLHDGAQQELVALKVKLGLARTIATREGATELADRLADTALVADLAVETLRDVARGIYPPLLDAEGLPAALSAQARRADLAVTVLDRGTPRYSRELESTAYFCALEALQNAARHSHAEHTHIELDGTGSTLTVTVTDNGAGFDPDNPVNGAGLAHMTDRAEAAGGTLTVDSRTGHGTTIRLALPVADSGAGHRAGPGVLEHERVER
jgi:signal transduction histidine kinase